MMENRWIRILGVHLTPTGESCSEICIAGVVQEIRV